MRRSTLLLLLGCAGLTVTMIARTQGSQVPAGPPGQTAPASDELFAKLYPVFAHPRCANCHGVVEHYPGFIFSVTPDTHPGGPVGADPHDPTDAKHPFNPTVECTDCHDDDELKGKWTHTAPPNMEWAGMAQDEVCVMQAAEVRLMNKKAGGESAAVKDCYLNHLATDPLIAQAWLGWAGGARAPLLYYDALHNKIEPPRPQSSLPVPPGTPSQFLADATKWVNAGAPCKAIGAISQKERQNTAYTIHQYPGQSLSFEQSAKHDVDIVCYRDGSAMATITTSGWNQTITTLQAAGCEIKTRFRNEWTLIGPSQVKAKLDITVQPDEYTIHFALPSESTRTRTTTVQTNTCGAPNPSIPESAINVEWEPWAQTFRCPTEFPNHDGTMGCLPTEPHDAGAADGALHQTVNGESDPEPRSWLYGSPMAIARIDNGEGLPVEVTVNWALRVNQK